MAESRASATMDRLPWLDDESRNLTGKKRAGAFRWAPLLVIAGAGVAAGSYWLGRETGAEAVRERPPVAAEIGKAETTMSLPQATKAVENAAAIAPPGVNAKAEARQPAPPPPIVRQGRVDIRRAKPVARTADKDVDKLDYWPATASGGASGRMVRIGTFASRAAAKKGWRAVMGIYPGMRSIPTAVVAIPSARDGVTYYRLQMGTTSQAHSEVLCQRMRIVGQSCVVIGLEWSAK
ncbi:MAG: hypothetical protein ABIO29_01040 [Sphingomicrobium sp.]